MSARNSRAKLGRGSGPRIPPSSCSGGRDTETVFFFLPLGLLSPPCLHAMLSFSHLHAGVSGVTLFAEGTNGEAEQWRDIRDKAAHST